MSSPLETLGEYMTMVKRTLLSPGPTTSFPLLSSEHILWNLATSSSNKPQAAHRQTHKEINRARLSLEPAAPKLQIMGVNHLGGGSEGV